MRLISIGIVALLIATLAEKLLGPGFATHWSPEGTTEILFRCAMLGIVVLIGHFYDQHPTGALTGRRRISVDFLLAIVGLLGFFGVVAGMVGHYAIAFGLIFGMAVSMMVTHTIWSHSAIFHRPSGSASGSASVSHPAPSPVEGRTPVEHETPAPSQPYRVRGEPVSPDRNYSILPFPYNKNHVNHLNPGTRMPAAWYAKTTLYGTATPSLIRKILINLLLAVSLLTFYGMGTSFFPSESWNQWGTTVAVVLTSVFTLPIWVGFLTGRLPVNPYTSKTRLFLIAAVFPFVIFPACWIAVLNGAGSLLTRANGRPLEMTASLKKEWSKGSARSCEFRVVGPPLESPLKSHLCISPSLYAELPNEFKGQLVGHTSSLGFQVEKLRWEANY